MRLIEENFIHVMNMQMIYEISNCNNYSILFRGQTPTVELFNVYLHSTDSCRFIEKYITKPLNILIQKDEAYRSVPTCVNFILQTLSEKWFKISDSVLNICYALKNRIMNVYHHKWEVLVGGFLFLRWLGPTLCRESNPIFRVITSYLIYLSNRMDNSSMERFPEFAQYTPQYTARIQDIINLLTKKEYIDLEDETVVYMPEEFLHKLQKNDDIHPNLIKIMLLRKMTFYD